jgi:hypothetical protein
MGRSPDISPLELEQTKRPFQPKIDRRPCMPEPLPVKLVAVEDLHAVAPAGIEPELDHFYVALLQFERDPQSRIPIYRAENFRLHFDVSEPPPHRQDMRPIVVEVRSLAEAEAKLAEQEIEFSRQRGLNSGEDQLVVQDPAGNWVSIVEARKMM